MLIKPLDYNSNLVSVRVKEELRNVVTNTGPHVISDDNLPILVRQLAVHANVSLFLLVFAKGCILLNSLLCISGSSCGWLQESTLSMVHVFLIRNFDGHRSKSFLM